MNVIARRQALAELARGGSLKAAITRLPWGARVGLAVFVVLVVVAAAPGLLAPYSPTRNFVGPPVHAPSGSFPLGTDQFGRDVLSRIIWGARVSVGVGLGSASIALLLGSLLGATAAAARGRLGELIMRLLDVVLCFPAVIFAVVIAAVLRPSVTSAIVVLSIVYTPAVARVVRGAVLAQLAEDYVAAETLIGASRPRILLRHVGPNVVAPVAVFVTVIVADAIFVEAALSFLGVGVQPPTASWGNIMNDGRQLIISGGWWVTTFAGAAVFTAVLSLNLLADGLSDAIAAPRRGAEARESAVGSRAVAVADHTRFDDETSVPTDALLSVRDLTISFPDAYGDVELVSGVTFDIARDEVIGLVGESGSGKSLTNLALMGLLPRGAHVSGHVYFQGRDLLALPERQRRALLGHEIAMVYQDALSSLNPSMSIGAQLRQVCRRGSRRTPEELLGLVGLPAALARSHAHELSGGQRQRVLIALALSREPLLLLADEPTTALDETVQAQILDLLAQLRAELGMSMLLVSHDLALVGEVADRVAVMYCGQIVETGSTDAVLADPHHPYTAGLLSSIASLESGHRPLAVIDGAVPLPQQYAPGCRFAGRCPNELPPCAGSTRPLHRADTGGVFACHNPVKHMTSLRP
jgi:peptide/nickel transport system permease protein